MTNLISIKDLMMVLPLGQEIMVMEPKGEEEKRILFEGTRLDTLEEANIYGERTVREIATYEDKLYIDVFEY